MFEEVQFYSGFQTVQFVRSDQLGAGELVQKLVVSQIVLVANQLCLSRLFQPSLQPVLQPKQIAVASKAIALYVNSACSRKNLR